MDEQEPQWSLLPSQPVEFFNLAEGYDRKDLKRAYNRLLRMYKPEKFPAEFQKIRSAYELLDARMRYGGANNASDQEAFSGWNASAKQESFSAHSFGLNTEEASQSSGQNDDSSSASKSVAETAGSLTPVERMVSRLGAETPESLYQELSGRPSHSPFELYSLAILSDALFKPEEFVFLKWLLLGLNKYPDEPGFFNLIFNLCQSDQMLEESLSEALIAISQVVSTDRFYFLTERLWDRYLQTVSWDQFEKTLERCQANINDYHVQGRTVFTCHLLRRAIWLAPQESVDAMVEYLEEHAEILSYGMDYDYELCLQLREYVRGREGFVNAGGLCAMIDDALRAYCLLPVQEADLKIVACQTAISQNEELLLSEFPFSLESPPTNLIAWLWISEEVLERLDLRESPNERQVMDATQKLLLQIDAIFPIASIQICNLIRWSLTLLGHALIFAVSLLVTVVVLVLLPDSAFDLMAPVMVILTVVCLILFQLRIKPITIDKWMGRYLQNVILRNYSSWWRSLIARFHAATHYSYSDTRSAAIGLINLNQVEFNASSWFPDLYSYDRGLAIYANAVRFLR
jgi:hypothetical protein